MGSEIIINMANILHKNAFFSFTFWVHRRSPEKEPGGTGDGATNLLDDTREAPVPTVPMNLSDSYITLNYFCDELPLYKYSS